MHFGINLTNMLPGPQRQDARFCQRLLSQIRKQIQIDVGGEVCELVYGAFHAQNQYTSDLFVTIADKRRGCSGVAGR